MLGIIVGLLLIAVAVVCAVWQEAVARSGLWWYGDPSDKEVQLAGIASLTFGGLGLVITFFSIATLVA